MATSHPMFKRKRNVEHADLAFELRRQFGSWLKSVRERCALTQLDVITHLKLGGVSSLSGVELGRIGMPPEWAERLIALYGVDKDEFVRRYLYVSNPWVYALIYGADARLRKLLSDLPDRKQ